MQEAEDQRLVEDHIRLLREETDCGFDVFMVREVDFLGKVEALLHGDGEISDPLDLLPRPISYGKLRHPHTVHKLLVILDDVVEDEVEEDEELHTHQFVVLGSHQEDFYLGDMRVQDVD